jgi:hypothetical protein
LVRSSGRTQKSNSCPEPFLAAEHVQEDCPRASPEPKETLRATPRYGTPWRLGYKHFSSTNLSTSSFQGVEATQRGARPPLRRRPVLTPERDAARAAPRPELPAAASCGWTSPSNHIVRVCRCTADFTVVDVPPPWKFSTCCSCAPHPSPPPLQTIIISTRQARRGICCINIAPERRRCRCLAV